MESFFPDLERPIFRKPRMGGRGLKLASSGVLSGSPCMGCPREKAVKVLPVLPPKAKLVAVGMAPGGEEEQKGKPFVGRSGILLRSTLRAVGLDPEEEVGYLNLGRCRPEDDDFESAGWKEAEKRCSRYLADDLAHVSVPLLLLGTRPVVRLLGDAKERVGKSRGLWVQTADGRPAFVARHPAQILRADSDQIRARLEKEFREDLQRMANKLLGREPPQGYEVSVFTSPFEAQGFLTKLTAHRAPWAFDIESYDGKEFPSRRPVATDPCHPDFRLRGIAIAWGSEKGVWIECKGLEDRRDEVRELFSPPFASSAEKWGFNGGFDEDGLVYPGWVREVRNRSGDGMLGLIALGDARHESLRLEKAVVDILKLPQYWDGLSKDRMRDISLAQVARNAVGDACRTFLLCQILHERIRKGEYLER